MTTNHAKSSPKFSGKKPWSRTRKKGFALIEMLMVVTIIGLLASLATPAIQNAKLQAQEAKRNTIKRAVETAKQRALIAGEPGVGPGFAASYVQFKKYLVINGVTAPPIATLTQTINNGAGFHISFWGTYGNNLTGANLMQGTYSVPNGTNIHGNDIYIQMQFNDTNWTGTASITNDAENFAGVGY